MLYLTWSLKYGEIAGDNPWQATGLEWQIQSPPLTENFLEIPDHGPRSLRLRMAGEQDQTRGNDRWIAKRLSVRQNDGDRACTKARIPPYLRHHFETVEQQNEATSFAMWLFLLTEIMFFGGLFMAYLIYRNWYYPAFVVGIAPAGHRAGAPPTLRC